jgi:uncharacterized lipoprotein YmbA
MSLRCRCLLLLAPVATLGCSLVHPYPTRSYYALPAVEVAPADGARRVVLEIPRASVAPPFDSRAFQYRVAESRYAPAYYAQWAGDPGSLLGSAVGEALSSTGAFTVLDDGSGVASSRLLLTVTELYADVRSAASPQAVVSIRATLLDERGVAVLTRVDQAETPASSDAPSDILDAWATGLATILESLSPAILTADALRPGEASDGPELHRSRP